MRPLRLEIEGFTAFRQPVELDMGELDLFAITGPTGAGKSSLIDAISYALYGRIPRLTAEVASCISQGLDRMHVTLDFMAGEERYRIYRETRRKGQGNVRLERLRDNGWQPLVDRARDVNTHVAEIVGLDYEGFTRSVILPQGQFQEFLAGAADKRRAVLRSLLRLEVYDRMRQRAAAMANETRIKLEERKQALELLADATPENRSRLEQERAEACREVEQRKWVLEALDQAILLAAALAQSRGSLTKCAAEARAVLAEYEKTRALVDEGDEGLEQLSRTRDSLQSKLAANAFDAERYAALGIALERVKALEQTRASLQYVEKAHADALKQAANAGTAAERARSALQSAESALAEASIEYEEAQRHNLAASLQQGLKPGDPCPVCGGKIGALVAYETASLEVSSKKLALAKKAEHEVRNSYLAASNAATRAAAGAENYEAQLQEMQSKLSDQEAAAKEALPADLDASAETVNKALSLQLAARTERQALEQQLQEKTRELAAKQEQLDAARKRLAALESRSQTAADALDSAQAEVLRQQEQLEAVVCPHWPDLLERLRDGSDASLLLRGRRDEAQSRRDELQRRVGELETRLQQMEKDIGRAQEIRRGLEGLQKEVDVSADLAQMLGAGKFQTFLQYEALHTLARDGSKRLELLSGGRYKLQVDEKGAEFEVVDQWNADSRSVKTLSGGETFLASLALSLALAESLPSLAASRRVVLDSIFLDEGFGSLDPEALDRAADALDALRGEERMVCVVTHLPELAQRLPARIEVKKTEAGSSVAVV